MKKRIQVTAGPLAQKILLKVVRKTNLETNLSVTAVDTLEAAATLGLNQMVLKLLPKEKLIKSLRD